MCVPNRPWLRYKLFALATGPTQPPLLSICFISFTAMLQEKKQDSVEKTPYAELQIEEDSDQQDPALPPPASSPPQKSKARVSAAAIIPVWILLSSAVIIYNNHVYTTLQFRYPVFLVTWHLTFAVSLHPPVNDILGRRICRPSVPASCNGRRISWTVPKMSICQNICSCAPYSPSGFSSAGVSSLATPPIYI